MTTAKIESKYGQELEISEFKNFATDKLYITAEQAGEVEHMSLKAVRRSEVP